MGENGENRGNTGLAGGGHETAPHLDHVDVWLFDLDNTLYPASCRLFDQIDEKMGAFICEFLGVDLPEARALQKRYYHAHGTTMRGLMDNHGLDPAVFLDFVHAIDHSPVEAAPSLDAALSALPGRKLIYTNGTVAHADAVLDRLGIPHHFEAIFDIVASDYVPKPNITPYQTLTAQFGLDPARTVFFDDIAKNLAPAAELGMTTVWVRTEERFGHEGADNGHVHHAIEDLSAWLSGVVAARQAGAVIPD